MDTRTTSDRADWTETTCDHCGASILESERRFIVSVVANDTALNMAESFIWCETCADLACAVS